MRICDVIEELNLDQIKPTDDQTGQIIDCYEDREWTAITRSFLRGIGSVHQVRGSVVHTLHGILDFYREYEMITRKQKFFIFHNILDNWDQISCESRADMLL